MEPTEDCPFTGTIKGSMLVFGRVASGLRTLALEEDGCRQFRAYMSYGLNLGWGTFRGLHRVLGGPIKGYTTNLVQDSLNSSKGGYMGEYIKEYYRSY